MPMTAEQKEWTLKLVGGAAPSVDAAPGGAAGASSLAQPEPQDPGTAAVTSLEATPDARLKSLYAQLDIDAPGGRLAAGDSCWSPKVALLGAWTAVIAAGAGTIALVLAPEPTTLTKWAALATAAALVGALVSLAAAYGAVADCEQGAADAADRKREIDDLRRQQQKIQETVDQLKREIGSK